MSPRVLRRRPEVTQNNRKRTAGAAIAGSSGEGAARRGPGDPGGVPAAMAAPANAQSASKTWELSLYELHRTPQVTAGRGGRSGA